MLALATAGLLIASYLTAVQIKLLAHAWDPIFGERNTSDVLALTHPVPDAAAGVLAYTIELVLLIARRGQLMLGLALSAGGLTGLALVIIQPVVVGAWCTFCLTSAGLSLGLLTLGRHEAIGALNALRRPRRALLTA